MNVPPGRRYVSNVSLPPSLASYNMSPDKRHITKTKSLCTQMVVTIQNNSTCPPSPINVILQFNQCDPQLTSQCRTKLTHLSPTALLRNSMSHNISHVTELLQNNMSPSSIPPPCPRHTCFRSLTDRHRNPKRSGISAGLREL